MQAGVFPVVPRLVPRSLGEGGSASPFAPAGLRATRVLLWERMVVAFPFPAEGMSLANLHEKMSEFVLA